MLSVHRVRQKTQFLQGVISLKLSCQVETCAKEKRFTMPNISIYVVNFEAAKKGVAAETSLNKFLP